MVSSPGHSPFTFLHGSGFRPVPRYQERFTLVRRRLLQQLIPPSPRDTPLVITLTAPAGFGKTVLASQVLPALHNRQYLWRNMDEQDHDPGLLLYDFARALHALPTHRPDRLLVLERPPLLPLSANDIRRSVALLRRYLDSIAEWGRVTLVLDDLHRLDQSPLSRLALQELLEILPDWIDIILVSQTAAVHAFIPRRNKILHLLTRTDLTFSAEEYRELADRLAPLRRPTGAETDRSCVEHDWPLAATLQVLGYDTPDQEQKRSRRLESCYAAFVQNLPRHLSDALLQLAGLDYLNDGVLGTLFGRKNGAALLNDLRAAVPFIFRVGDSTTFGLCPSFAAYLRQHPDHLFLPNRPQLFYKLALYCAAVNDFRTALIYAAHGCHFDLICDILETFSISLLEDPDDRCLRRVLRHLPPSVVRSRPWLALFAGLLDRDQSAVERRELLAVAGDLCSKQGNELGLLVALAFRTEDYLFAGPATADIAAELRQIEKLFVSLRERLPPVLLARIAHLLAGGFALIFGRTRKATWFLNLAPPAEQVGSDLATTASRLIVAAFCADLEARWPDLIETLEAAEELLVDQAAAPRFVPLLTYLRLKALAMNGDFDQYRRLAQQLQAGDWQHQPGTAAVLPYVTILTWDSALADEAYRRGLQEVERGLVQIDGTRQPQELGLLLLCRALTLALLARPTEAVEDLQRANDLLTGKTGHHYAALHHSLAAIASYHLGRVADGDRHQARVEKLNQLLEYPFHWVGVSSHRAYCLLRTGQLDQALPSVVQAMRLLVGEQRRHTLCWLPSVATTVLRAAVLHEQEADYARSLLAQRFHCWCGLDGVLLPVLDIVILKEQAITNGQKRLFFHELTVQERKLLLHVSLAPGMAIPQTSAAEELWPEKDPERQRSSLDNLVSRLRSKLKALIPSPAAKQYLTIEQGYVTLKHVSVDVNRFFDAAQQALDHVNRGRKWRAELLFAEAFALLDTAFVRPFDFAYLEELQDRFELELANALQAATDLLLRKDDFDTARNYALAAFRYCPGHPHLVRTCYQLLRRYGDHSGAGAILAAYRRTQEKYAEDPSELAELIELVTA